MSERVEVTVVMIFYNGEEFIREAIESVLEQSYREWELILVDDGSTDGSRSIAEEYARRWPQKARLVQHANGENRGMSASRNLGISEARGKYIAFLDADDVWVRDKLREQVEILEREPDAGMVYGATEYWYSWSGREEDRGRDYVPELGLLPDTLINPPDLLPVLLKNQIVTSTCGLIRRDTIRSIGGYEESFQGLFEDQAFCAKLSLKAPVFVSSKCWYKYRKHPNSCCSVAERNGEQYGQRLTFLSWLESYVNARGVNDAKIRRSINQARWKCRYPKLSRLSDDIRYRRLKMKEQIKSIARRALPSPVYGWLKARRNGKEDHLPVGGVNFGDLRRLNPISRVFGFDRGTPVDRYYIEKFLSGNAADIRGHLLEVGDDFYTRKFGEDRVTKSDVLHVSEDNPKATIIADLSNADHIPTDSFDCIILTQTLHLIYDVRTAIATLHRILKPRGVLLTTFPGISQIDHYDWGSTWYWSFTRLSARRMFSEVFPQEGLTVEAQGNVLAATAFLHGIALEELRIAELDFRDRDYEVTISVRAVKGDRS